MESLLELRQKHGYSVLACRLDAALPFSGAGRLQGHVVWVYFEPEGLQRLSMALMTIGVDLNEGEVEAVDPSCCNWAWTSQMSVSVSRMAASGSSFEQELFLSRVPIFRWDNASHSASEEIRLKGWLYYPWEGRLEMCQVGPPTAWSPLKWIPNMPR